MPLPSTAKLLKNGGKPTNPKSKPAPKGDKLKDDPKSKDKPKTPRR